MRSAFLICIAAALWFLYPMAQQYYVGLRTQDKLEAEYALLSERNAAIQSDIDRLSTDEGIEDVAREQLVGCRRARPLALWLAFLKTKRRRRPIRCILKSIPRA